MVLDLKTLAFTISLVSLNATIVMVLLSILGKQYRATIYWAVGGAFSSIGFILLMQRGIIPNFFSIIVANLFSAICLVAMFLGILKFMGDERKIPRAFWLLFLLLPFFLYFSFFQESLLFRSVISAVFAATLMLFSAYTLLVYSPRALRLSHWFAGGNFLVGGIFQIFRGISLFYVNTSYGVFSDNWLQTANFISTVIFFDLVDHGFCFHGHPTSFS